MGVNSKEDILKKSKNKKVCHKGLPNLIEISSELSKRWQMTIDHPLYKTLCDIFTDHSIIKSIGAMEKLGFIRIANQRSTRVQVLRHPLLNGYLVKVLCDCTDKRYKNHPQKYWYEQRCLGADNIRAVINKYNLKSIIVPNKVIFTLPNATKPDKQCILIVDDVYLTSKEDSIKAWKKADSHVIDELYCLLSHGYGSGALPINIPYCKNGTFACIDTEYPQRDGNYMLSKVTQYLSIDSRMHLRRIVGQSIHISK